MGIRAEEGVAKQRDGAPDGATGKERKGWSAGQRDRERNRMDLDSPQQPSPRSDPTHLPNTQSSPHAAVPKARLPVSLWLQGVHKSKGARTGPGRGGTLRSVTVFYYSVRISPFQTLNLKCP